MGQKFQKVGVSMYISETKFMDSTLFNQFEDVMLHIYSKFPSKLKEYGYINIEQYGLTNNLFILQLSKVANFADAPPVGYFYLNDYRLYLVKYKIPEFLKLTGVKNEFSEKILVPLSPRVHLKYKETPYVIIKYDGTSIKAIEYFINKDEHYCPIIRE